MDTLTASTAFATIVGLISNFRQERGAAEQLDHRQFIEWLDYHQHQEIKDLISNTYHLQAEVDQLLRADHEVIIKKLDMLGSAMASLASHVAEFRPLAMKLVPSAELSEQSVSILRQLVASGSKGFLCIKTLGGSSLCLDRGGNIDHHESRFLDDDLNVLVSLDLLSVKNNSQRGGWYGITRNAVRLLESIDGKESG